MNITVQEEVRGFNAAMEFFNRGQLTLVGPIVVMAIADTLLRRHAQTYLYNYYQGFHDAAVIVARSRKLLDQLYPKE